MAADPGTTPHSAGRTDGPTADGIDGIDGPPSSGPERRPGLSAMTATDAELDELLDAATGGQPNPTGDRSLLGGVLWALAALPSVALILLLSMAVRVRLDQGAWPVRNQPDPKDLGLHNTVTTVAILASLVAVVLVPLVALAGYFAGHRRIPFKPPLVAVAGVAVLLVVLVGDLGGLGEWIGD